MDLSYNDSVLATALYGPYGVGRYATGTMPSSKGYTGQRQDSGSGLDYYNARYYDGAIGQFTSADSVQGPNRYGYVGGNPETATDPTGKRRVLDDSNFDTGQDLGPHPWLMGNPDVLVWGTSTNNVVVYRYSGKDLQALSKLANDYYKSLSGGFLAYNNAAKETVRDVMIGGLFGGAGLLLKAGAGVSFLLGLGSGRLIEGFGRFGGISNQNYMNALSTYVSQLSDAASKSGGSIDFVVASVNGRVTITRHPTHLRAQSWSNIMTSP